MKQVYLIIESKFPTIHKSLKEAQHYLTFVRDTDIKHKKLEAIFCEFTPKDLKENFANCIFKSFKLNERYYLCGIPTNK